MPLRSRSLPSTPQPAASASEVAALLAAKNDGMVLDAGRRFLLVLACALHDEARMGPAELLRVTKASIAPRVVEARERRARVHSGYSSVAKASPRQNASNRNESSRTTATLGAACYQAHLLVSCQRRPRRVSYSTDRIALMACSGASVRTDLDESLASPVLDASVSVRLRLAVRRS